MSPPRPDATRQLVGQLWSALTAFAEDPRHCARLSDTSEEERLAGAPKVSFELSPENPSAAGVAIVAERDSIIVTIAEMTTVDLGWTPPSVGRSIENTLTIVEAVARGGFRRDDWVRGEEKILDAVGLIQWETGGPWKAIGRSGTPLSPLRRPFGRRMTRSYPPWCPRPSRGTPPAASTQES
jgi:hypothetical protein